MHWREAARNLNVKAIDIDEMLTDKDEDYALYNFLFLCRQLFAESIRNRDDDRVNEVVEFVALCLRQEVETDGKDCQIAAGASFAEHLFDDVREDEYAIVYERVGPDFYLLCRSWLKRSLDPDQFSVVDSLSA